MNILFSGFQILLRALALVSLIAFFSCSKFNYQGGDKDDGDRGREKYKRPLKEFEDPDLSMKNCKEYKSNVTSFRLSDVFFGGRDNNVFRHLESCILKAMDKSLKPVCDEERELKELREEYKHDEEALEEIEEDLDYIEETKYEFADVFYEFVDGIEEIGDEVEGEVDKRITDPISNTVVQIFGPTREIRSYSDVIARKARKLCGSSLRQPKN